MVANLLTFFILLLACGMQKKTAHSVWQSEHGPVEELMDNGAAFLCEVLQKTLDRWNVWLLQGSLLTQGRWDCGMKPSIQTLW